MLVRPAAVSGLALSAAFIAVAPTVVAPPEVAVAAPPAVHIEELHLAGIGQDIYQAITDSIPIVAYNQRFDLSILHHEHVRAGGAAVQPAAGAEVHAEHGHLMAAGFHQLMQGLQHEAIAADIAGARERDSQSKANGNSGVNGIAAAA